MSINIHTHTHINNLRIVVFTHCIFKHIERHLILISELMKLIYAIQRSRSDSV